VDDHYSYRQLAATYDGSGSLFIGGLSWNVDINGDKDGGSAAADINGFVFKWDRPNVAMGIVGFEASANFDYTPAANGNNGSIIYSFSAAFAEFIIAYDSIFLWQNKNGQSGFQYSLGDNVWDCVADNLDCIQPWSGISPKKDLIWTFITVTKQSCPLGSGYSSNCTIYHLESTGFLGIDRTMKLTLVCANQKVIVKSTAADAGHEIGPDYCKVTVEIWYPYVAKQMLGFKDTTNIGLSTVFGGKVGSAGITGGTFQGRSAVVFAAAGTDTSAVWAWDGAATIDSVECPITLTGISGDSIINYDCSQCDPFSKIVIGLWQFYLNIASAGGWTTELYIVSWDKTGANYVYYDPTAGMASNSDIQSNAAGFMAPTAILSIFWVVMSFL